MGVSSPPLPIICIYLAAALIGKAHSEGVCLHDGTHKATPSPELHLSECGLYADNSCCTEDNIQDINYFPSASNKNEPWDKCGALSPECEGYLKRVSCFYRCSPDASRWPHPHRRSYIQAVPLCHSFCRDWFDACRTDMTCARNWARDPRGQNCTGTCVPYQQGGAVGSSVAMQQEGCEFNTRHEWAPSSSIFLPQTKNMRVRLTEEGVSEGETGCVPLMDWRPVPRLSTA